MADFERHNEEEGLKRFLGIQSFHGRTTLGEWLMNIGMLLESGRNYFLVPRPG
jgi:hypothetical protein